MGYTKGTTCGLPPDPGEDTERLKGTRRLGARWAWGAPPIFGGGRGAWMEEGQDGALEGEVAGVQGQGGCSSIILRNIR